jgi:hypothetical protein
VPVDGSGVTQPVSAASLPLPTGAATAAKQPSLGTAGTPSADVLTVQGAASMTALKTDGSAVTQPVSAASLPLPTGAATAANQTTGNNSLSSIDGKVPALVTGRVPVDGSGVTQPVSGTVTANAGTNLNTSALALESGGNLAGIRTDLGTDGTTPPTLPGGSTGVRGWLRYVASLLPSLGTAGTPSSNVISVQGVASGTAQPVSATSLPLPTGAATETTLAAANTKLPTLALGAQAPSASLAVNPANKLTVTGPSGQSASNTDLLTGSVNGWYDAAAFNYVSFTIVGSAGISAGGVILEQTNDTTSDASGAALANFPEGGVTFTQIASGAFNIAASSVTRRAAYLSSRYVRVRISTPFSGGTVQCIGVFSSVAPPAPFAASRVDVQSIGGTQNTNFSANGNTLSGIASIIASNFATTEYSAQNVAAASGSLSINTTSPTLPCLTFDVNLTAFTAGSSTGLDLFLQESPDNGTTYYDIWQCEAFTASGRARIPSIPVNGRRRIRWVNRTGAATTATLTVTSMGVPTSLPIQRQFFDRTSGVGSGTAVLNTRTTSYLIDGCGSFAVAVDAGAATGAATLQVQFSMNGSTWFAAGAATSCTASTVTLLPITNGLAARFLSVVVTNAGTSAVINKIDIYATSA